MEKAKEVLNALEAELEAAMVKIPVTAVQVEVLMENKGKTVSRDVLMQRLWESDSFVDENTLSVNVARLRKKLDGAGLENFITTKKGMGYIVE